MTLPRLAVPPFRPVRRALSVVVLCSFSVSPMSAQDASTYYTVRNPGKFSTDWGAFYATAGKQTAEVRRALPHHLDLAYGPDAKQRLDLYLPPGRAEKAPVFIFIHGGGFLEGDRAQYGYIARPFAQAGIITVVASYRLLPRVYPDQLEDTHRMIAWAFGNAARYGGDPNAIYVGGHSAGAILSALVGVTTGWQAPLGLPPDVVKGIVPVSGPYDLRNATGFVKDFLPDPATRTPASPALQIQRTPPAVVAYGSLEKPYVEASRAFAETLRSRGGDTVLVALDGMGHDATALAAGDPASALAKAAVQMIAKSQGRATPRPATSAQGAILGMWRYETLARQGGTAVALDGLFLFQNGRYYQHSLNRGTPLEQQLAQGHVGTYTLGSDGELVMRAEVGFLVDPEARPVFINREGEHRAMAVADGESLTLTFATKTVQKLSRVAAGAGEVMALKGGALAIVGRQFLIVHADGARALTASGEAMRQGDTMTLRAARWVAMGGARGPGTFDYRRDVEIKVSVRPDGLEIPGYGVVAFDRTSASGG